ncbi:MULTISPECIES: efflux RND transporter permease subunit [unclassified Candidatus Frackibacter]|uniref:efflux RND transporter permease subunit n=1 Tax=unclassified Candidatus Frackibacter TaxID=2648818 RepID=UPI0008844D73|nr:MULTISPECIES: efflux RND transporter permease subunit [unclassified Candidatus Frackibacter]SDC47703.1 heavy metal efflux pump, CzcA family [Candidatus Frackibacter sp. WG11]SEM81052.1 heavy metal efflux pump, CzcA family [Candidatus Frackibacter sp. WG12]SFL72985.1 heavy metal efflux pump, CzcA family [Candidatus Frackibacter sp. WG13]
MNLPKFSVEKPYTVVASVLIILLLGVLAFNTLQVKLYPELNPTVITVMTEYSGVSAVDVDELINEPLEDELGTVEGIKSIEAKAQQGISIVTAEFGYEKDINVAAVDIQNVINRIRNQLPKDIEEPKVLKVDSSNKPVLTISVNGLNSLVKLRSLVENEIRPQFQVVDGISAVNLFGGLEREVIITVDKSKLKAYQIPINAITQRIKNENVNKPAGKITIKKNEYLIRAIGEYEKIKDLKNIVISNFNGRLVKLGDVARVKDSHAEKRSQFRVNGKETVAINIKKTDEANTVEVVKKAKRVLSNLKQDYPQLTFEIVDDQSDLVNIVVNSMVSSLRSGIILTIIILFLYLTSVRSTLIVALSIPATFLVALTLIKLSGLTLNMVTMSGLILATGMLVDDSIVVTESIVRHIKLGKSPYRAAVKGAKEIMLASMAGTTTSIIVLLPLIFVGGFVQQMFRPLALTLVFAWTASVILSLTFIPFLASVILKRDNGLNRLEKYISFFSKGVDFLREKYIQILEFGLGKWYIVIPLILMIFVGTIRMVPQIGAEKLPKMDSGQIYISIESEPGSSLKKTSNIVKQVEEILAQEEEIVTFSSQIGFESGSLSSNKTGAIGVQQANISVILTDRHDRQESIWQIEDRIRTKIAKIPGIRSAVVREVGTTVLSTTEAPVVVRISGADLKKLEKIANEIKDKISNVQGLSNIATTWTLNNPEYHLDLDHQRLADLNLTANEVVKQTMIGLEGLEVSKFNLPYKDDLDIRVKYQEEDQNQLTDLDEVMIKSPNGPVIPLKSLVEIKKSKEANLITREDFKKTIKILAYNQGRPLSKVANEVKARLQKANLPAGYEAKLVGQQEDLKKSMKRMGISFVLAILLVYIVLISQFKSFGQPLIIMLAIPLELIGVVGALFITGKYLSLPAMMGIILVTGIVVNNSILLIDRTISNREEGLDLKEAIIEAAATRFRPILMTVTSTIGGMLPLALALATGSERFAPLATSVIGGLIVSTFLTLILIPVVYNLAAKIRDNR